MSYRARWPPCCSFNSFCQHSLCDTCRFVTYSNLNLAKRLYGVGSRLPFFLVPVAHELYLRGETVSWLPGQILCYRRPSLSNIQVGGRRERPWVINVQGANHSFCRWSWQRMLAMDDQVWQEFVFDFVGPACMLKCFLTIICFLSVRCNTAGTGRMRRYWPCCQITLQCREVSMLLDDHKHNFAHKQGIMSKLFCSHGYPVHRCSTHYCDC